MERGREADRASGQRRHAADERNRKAGRDLPRKMETGTDWREKRETERGIREEVTVRP